MKIVLIGHGKTGVAFKDAVQMIFGKADNFIPLTFEPGEGLKDVSAKVEKAISGFDPKNVLVITDLFSGTPYNATAALALKGKVKDVIAGMSLPILLEVATKMDNTSIDELVKDVLKNAPEYTHALSAEMEKQDKEDDL